jgi:uncharacterized protein with HEPN domain
MSKSNFRFGDYLCHILNAIHKIERYLAGMDKETFLLDDRTQDAVIRNIEIIGEASANIIRKYPEFTEEYGDVPWEFAYGMRNRLAHGYSEVNLEVVWNTTVKSLPLLKAQISAIAATIANSP